MPGIMVIRNGYVFDPLNTDFRTRLNRHNSLQLFWDSYSSYIYNQYPVMAPFL
jgi:hypothetical protein